MLQGRWGCTFAIDGKLMGLLVLRRRFNSDIATKKHSATDAGLDRGNKRADDIIIGGWYGGKGLGCKSTFAVEIMVDGCCGGSN